MSTWGMGTFEDDDARDWLNDLQEHDTAFLEKTLRTPLPNYLSAPDGQVLLAAAEVVAAMKGAPAEDFPDDMEDWLKSQHVGIAAQLAPLAIDCLKRVAGNQSELHELWKENADEYADWQEYMRDLHFRLKH